MIRIATEADASVLLAIYAEYVKNTAISFEYDIPSVEEFRIRIHDTLEKYPYLVCIRDGEIAGYVYVSEFHHRIAYARSVETSIYVKSGLQKSGVGRELYAALEKALSMQHIINLNACVTCPDGDDPYLTRNSFDFHQHMGYRQVGEFHKCGYKFGRWYNVAWLEKFLSEHIDTPLPVLTFPTVRKQFEAELAAQQPI